MKFNALRPFQESMETTKEGITPMLKFITETRFFLEKIYESYNDPDARIEEIMKQLEPFFRHIDKDVLSYQTIKDIRESLEDCREIKGKKKFIDKVIEILKPIFDVKKTHSQEYEEAEARASNEKQGYIELNRLVTYEKSGDTVQLHHSLAKTIGPKRELYNDAMRKLAKVVKDDPNIQIIEATSWIVAKAPTLFTRNGFTVENVDSSDSLLSGFDSFDTEDLKEKETATASISRDKFLQVFGADSA